MWWSWTLTTGCHLSANRLKLNIDKTELLWAGTRRSLSMGDGSFPSLQLGKAISSHQVNMLECLEWFFRLTSASRSMFPTSARPASTICVDYGTSGVHWLRSLPRHSCTPLWRPATATPASTTVTLSSLGLQRSSPTSCNECWTRQLLWSGYGRSTAVWGFWCIYTELHWLDVPERVKYKLAVWSHAGVCTVLLPGI